MIFNSVRIAVSDAGEFRRLMGAPKDWKIVDSWLEKERVPYACKEPSGMAELSWPKIKELRDYRVNPEESF